MTNVYVTPTGVIKKKIHNYNDDCIIPNTFNNRNRNELHFGRPHYYSACASLLSFRFSVLLHRYQGQPKRQDGPVCQSTI